MSNERLNQQNQAGTRRNVVAFDRKNNWRALVVDSDRNGVFGQKSGEPLILPANSWLDAICKRYGIAA